MIFSRGFELWCRSAGVGTLLIGISRCGEIWKLLIFRWRIRRLARPGERDYRSFDAGSDMRRIWGGAAVGLERFGRNLRGRDLGRNISPEKRGERKGRSWNLDLFTKLPLGLFFYKTY